MYWVYFFYLFIYLLINAFNLVNSDQLRRFIKNGKHRNGKTDLSGVITPSLSDVNNTTGGHLADPVAPGTASLDCL